MNHNVQDQIQVAIIGAGPYGLSTAAHLRTRGVEFRIFGQPMHSWMAEMPSDMLLKSEGFATNLCAPEDYRLEHFCAEKHLPYKYMGLPIPRETFVAYGLAFQQRFVPTLEKKNVVALDRLPIGWRLDLDSGETVMARQVVVAVGSSPFYHVPPTIADLPSEFLSHSCHHSDLSPFKGRDVTVIGGGASACDVAASLHRVGARVRLVARQSMLRWVGRAYRPLWGRLYPGSGLGGGWRNRCCENLQLVFRRLPEETRIRIVRRHLGPAGTWTVKTIVERLPLLLGHVLQSAKVHNGRVRLELTGKDGKKRDVLTDHIIAATGFKVDVGKLTFLNGDVRAQIQTVGGAPSLSDNFESSVPGLYFTGLAAANTFGPSMRFVLGTRFAARRLGRHLAKSSIAVNTSPGE